MDVAMRKRVGAASALEDNRERPFEARCAIANSGVKLKAKNQQAAAKTALIAESANEDASGQRLLV